MPAWKKTLSDNNQNNQGKIINDSANAELLSLIECPDLTDIADRLNLPE